MQKVMNVVFVLILCVCAVIYTSKSKETAVETLQEQMTAFTRLMDSASLVPKQWHVRAKKEKALISNKEMFFEQVHLFARTQPTFELSSIEETSHEHLKAVFLQKDHIGAKEVQVSFVAVPEQGQFTLTKVYEYVADASSEQTMDDKKVVQQLEDLNFADATLYVQVSAETLDPLTFSAYETAQKWVRQLGATEKESLSEEAFVSLSGYNDAWQNGVPLSTDEEMNVQVALRQSPYLGGATKVTLGTPIITTEY
ncbi:YwmB family TATA-box binding protein [Shouchella lonarensis]|uniref:TATA-box binding n=1 Tax=Shouchella lonarensis TaxID=1464122 RepID=A0A1G6GXL5_9BACI|nr:YwmB family TATA-box binding protein [Shouchella lonarensis]SDB86653.1 TATA-box binding [Shouchella lonarensis]